MLEKSASILPKSATRAWRKARRSSLSAGTVTKSLSVARRYHKAHMATMVPSIVVRALPAMPTRAPRAVQESAPPREEARDEVHLPSRRGRDHAARVDAGQRPHVGAQRAHVVLGVEDHHEV